jgi:hypothetical protein
LTQVPVFFEDGSFDVMRSMNIKKRADLLEEKRSRIQELMNTES